MPKTGSLVMIDEICDIVAVWTVCIYVIVRIIQSRGRFQASVKAVRILVIAACVVIGVLFTGSTALDLGVRPGDGSIDGYTGQQIPGAYRYLFASLLSDRNGQPGRTCPAGDIGRRLHQTVGKQQRHG